jgi:hypothetical protein
MPRFAVVMTIAARNVTDDSSRFLLCMLRGNIDSLRAVGFEDDVVCLTHGFDTAALSAHGCSRVVRVARPLFDAGPELANTSVLTTWMRHHLRVPPPLASNINMHRFGNFGDMTVVKLSAWRLTQYDFILHTDLDVLFFESPHRALEESHAKRLVFQAAHYEVAGRT